MAKTPVIAISHVPEPLDDAVIDSSYMELPTGAEAQPDGSVILALDRPVKLRSGAGEEEIEQLHMLRLHGAEMRKVLSAKDGSKVMLGLSIGFPPARLALFYAKADAADMTAATKVVAEMVQFGEGLPDDASKHADGTVTLPIHMPFEHDGELIQELHFKRLTGGDLDTVKRTEGVETLLRLLSRSIGKTPKVMGDMFDLMDGRDIIAAQRVTAFLSGSGRLTGR